MAVWYILRSFGTFCGHLVHFVVIWYILWSFGTFCSHWVHFVVIWYIFHRFGNLYQEKSGNPAFGRFFSLRIKTGLLFSQKNVLFKM
jgi:hypothetical protein